MIEMNRKPIIVITRKPMAKNFLQLLIKFFRHPRSIYYELVGRKKIYAGHPAVTKSLLRGLGSLKKPFVYDPILATKIKGNVIVLADPEALRLSIELKEQGKIVKLFAGPNVMVKADDFDRLYSNKNIDKILVPAKWVKYSYEYENPDTKNRLFIWPSGIDFAAWEPSPAKKQKKVVLYKKYPATELPKNFYETISNSLKESNYEVQEITYGNYKNEDYKKNLATAVAMVYVSKSESQGIALLEAWAMDVPTFVWESDFKKEGTREFKEISAAPYLSTSVGKFWKDPSVLKIFLEPIQLRKYKPRKWSIRRFTDAKSAELLLHELEK